MFVNMWLEILATTTICLCFISVHYHHFFLINFLHFHCVYVLTHVNNTNQSNNVFCVPQTRLFNFSYAALTNKVNGVARMHSDPG